MTSATPLPVTTGRRSGRSSRASSLSLHHDDHGARCGFVHSTAFSVIASVALATLVTLTLLNAYVHGLTGPAPGAALGGVGPRAGPPGHGGVSPAAAAAASARLLAALPPGGVVTLPPNASGGGDVGGAAASATALAAAAGAGAAAAGSSPPPAGAAGPPPAAASSAAPSGGGGGDGAPKKAPRPFKHPFTDPKYRLFSIPAHDPTQRCARSGICDGDHACGPDQLGCVVSAKRRQDHIREAIRWSWQGYRWGSGGPAVCGGGRRGAVLRGRGRHRAQQGVGPAAAAAGTPLALGPAS
jgi:hypothetical protein